MTLRPSGKSGEETPWGGPRDGASAELEIITIVFIRHTLFYRMWSVEYFAGLAEFLEIHGGVSDS
jgi:hypothetical protein